MWESLLAKFHFLEELLSLFGFPLFSLLHLFLHREEFFIWSIVQVQITWQDESMENTSWLTYSQKGDMQICRSERVCITHLPWSSPSPMAINASRSVPFKPYFRSSLAASTFSGTLSTHSCSTHDLFFILLCGKKRKI